MNQELIRKQQDLTARLNRYRHEYYNLNAPSISDAVYDRLFEELQDLERQTGIQMANSPTSTVGYPAISKLEKTNHPIPLLSLDKEKKHCGGVPLHGRASGDVHAQTGRAHHQVNL